MSLPIIWSILLVGFCVYLFRALEGMLRFDRATDPRVYVPKARAKGHRVVMYEDIQ